MVGPEGHSYSRGNFMGMHWQSETIVQHYNNHEFVPTIFNTRTRFDDSGCQVVEYLNDNGQWVRVNPPGGYTTSYVGGYGWRDNGSWDSNLNQNNSGPSYYNSGPNNGLPFERRHH